MLTQFFAVTDKLSQPLVGQRMLQQAQNSFERTGGHLGTHLHTFDNVAGVTDRGGQHFAGPVVTVRFKGFDNRGNQSDPVFRNVVQTAHEGRHVRCSGFGGQHGLSHAEDQRTVGADFLAGEVFDGPDPGFGAGDLDHNVRMESGQGGSFGDHAFVIGAEHFGADVAVNERQNELIGNAMTALATAIPEIETENWELAAVQIRSAVEALGEITGENAGVDVLDNIFSRFCIGK